MRHNRKQNEHPPEAELLQAGEVAEILGINKSTVWSWYNSGKIPSPMRIGGITRWRREEILAWIKANTPPRSKWHWPELA